jgi:hypothetical protein
VKSSYVDDAFARLQALGRIKVCWPAYFLEHAALQIQRRGHALRAAVVPTAFLKNRSPSGSYQNSSRAVGVAVPLDAPTVIFVA